MVHLKILNLNEVTLLHGLILFNILLQNYIRILGVTKNRILL